MTAQNGSHLPNWFIRNVDGLTSIERMVWVVLSNRAGTKGWNLNATEIARQAGCAERSVYPALAILEHCGLIVRTRRGRETKQARNRYRVTETPPAIPASEELARLRRAARETAPRAVSKGHKTAPRAVSTLHHVQAHTAPCADSDCTTCSRKETQETQEMNPPSGDSSSVSLERTTTAAPAALREGSAPLPQPLEEVSDEHAEIRDQLFYAIGADDLDLLLARAMLAADLPNVSTDEVLDMLVSAALEGAKTEHEINMAADTVGRDLFAKACDRGTVCSDVAQKLPRALLGLLGLNGITVIECEPAVPGRPRMHVGKADTSTTAPAIEGAAP